MFCFPYVCNGFYDIMPTIMASIHLRFLNLHVPYHSYSKTSDTQCTNRATHTEPWMFSNYVFPSKSSKLNDVISPCPPKMTPKHFLI